MQPQEHPPAVQKALREILAYTLNNGLGGMRFLIPEVRVEDMELGDWEVVVRRVASSQ